MNILFIFTTKTNSQRIAPSYLRDRRTDGQTDGRTDREMVRQTDGEMVRQRFQAETESGNVWLGIKLIQLVKQ